MVFCIAIASRYIACGNGDDKLYSLSGVAIALFLGVRFFVGRSEGSIGDPAVSALYGKVGASEFGLLVTLGVFTTQAKNFARSKTNLRLIDGDELVQLVFQHYDKFDSRYKGLLPLRRVYVPEIIESGEE